MRLFQAALAARNPAPAGRRWLYVPYDQLSDELGPLAREDPATLGIVLVESAAKAARRPYHRQKLALILANQRHFALEQAARGVAVRYLSTRGDYATALRRVVAETGPLRVQEPAEWELRQELAPLVAEGLLVCLPHEGWLTDADDFRQAFPKGPPWRMDAFYRRARRKTGVLMEGERFAGGQLSFDADNRKPWRGTPAAPRFPRFSPDPITAEVVAFVEERFADHPGTLDATTLPATRDDAERLWAFAYERCLPHFGPYEDAMSVASTTLFHSCISPLLHLHRVLPARVVREAAAHPEASIASREGFVRQVLGWREFMRHVHVETEGLRRLPPLARRPLASGETAAGEAVADHEGSAPSFLGAHAPLPPAYWGTPSGLACLDRVVADVWREGYSHHITRLMVLANLATLLGISPRALTDWFWVAYIDAYDWVVEPNVLGMGTFGLGELFVTKPYVSGAAYLHRMSDYCGTCAFDPRKSCPITPLYWDFLARNADALGKNPRMAMPLRSLVKRSEAQRASDARVSARVQAALQAGERVTPEG